MGRFTDIRRLDVLSAVELADIPRRRFTLPLAVEAFDDTPVSGMILLTLPADAVEEALDVAVRLLLRSGTALTVALAEELAVILLRLRSVAFAVAGAVDEPVRSTFPLISKLACASEAAIDDPVSFACAFTVADAVALAVLVPVRDILVPMSSVPLAIDIAEAFAVSFEDTLRVAPAVLLALEDPDSFEDALRVAPAVLLALEDPDSFEDALSVAEAVDMALDDPVKASVVPVTGGCSLAVPIV